MTGFLFTVEKLIEDNIPCLPMVKIYLKVFLHTTGETFNIFVCATGECVATLPLGYGSLLKR